MALTKPKAGKVIKHWFKTGPEESDRTLDQQLLGLEELFEFCPNKIVLDVGCAEGLIGLATLEAGASYLHGFEILDERIQRAKRFAREKQKQAFCDFWVDDAQQPTRTPASDITLLLAILHKLPEPARALRRYARLARELLVVRIPPQNAPFILDRRSNFSPVNVTEILAQEDYSLRKITRGAYDEWCGYFYKAPL